jgi:hypothetical protein
MMIQLVMSGRPSHGEVLARFSRGMLMCEILAAVHHKLPVKAVVYNNSASE